jgi:hypothetical protein
MTTELFFSVGAGLVLLGIAFVILDYFLARVCLHLRRTGIVGRFDQEMLVSIAKPAERWRVKVATKTYEAAVTHRMRRGAFIVIVIGVAVLLGTWAF